MFALNCIPVSPFQYWPWDPSANVLCKVVKTAPAMPVFSSTLILMVIAVDRYRTIVYSGRRQLMPRHVMFIAPIVLGNPHLSYQGTEHFLGNGMFNQDSMVQES